MHAGENQFFYADSLFENCSASLTIAYMQGFVWFSIFYNKSWWKCIDNEIWLSSALFNNISSVFSFYLCNLSSFFYQNPSFYFQTWLKNLHFLAERLLQSHKRPWESVQQYSFCVIHNKINIIIYLIPNRFR